MPNDDEKKLLRKRLQGLQNIFQMKFIPASRKEKILKEIQEIQKKLK